MATPPKCKKCGQRAWGLCPNCAAQPASNNASNIPSIASNGSDPASNIASNKQRWSREAYNVYMRDYMQRKRHA